MSEIETRLRAEASRDATAFDAALHARVMRRVGDVADARDDVPTRHRWRIGAALAAAASVAVGVSWLAWPAPRTPQAAVPAIPWEPDGSIARLYASPVASPSPADVALAGDFSRLLRSQFDLATSFRPARRNASPT